MPTVRRLVSVALSVQARWRRRAGVKKLVLVHMGPHISQHGPLEKGIGDIREVYSGEVVYAEELMKLEV